MTAPSPPAPPDAVLARYGLAGARAEAAGAGLINRTWVVQTPGGRYVLQQVNPMFGMEIHADIAAVTQHLAGKGLPTPRLVSADDGAAAVRHEGRLWRLYEYLEGVTFDRADTGIAREAGRVLAGFHEALLDLDYRYRNRRPGVHDTPAHLRRLRETLQARGGHPGFRRVAPLGEEILTLAAALPPLPALAPRKVHGDPKINNCLFDPHGPRGICMIDFDTLGEMPLPLELGDALRSWCNPAGENTADTSFSLDHLEAALAGYAAVFRENLSEAERLAILPATRTIYLELAARFCADALNEDFFSWDPRSFASHTEHSLVRAAGQLNALKSLEGQLPQAERMLVDIFRGNN